MKSTHGNDPRSGLRENQGLLPARECAGRRQGNALTVREFVHQALLLACVGATLSPQLSHADGLPTGGHYVAGAGTIATTGATTTITQGWRRGIIDWQSFSVDSGKTVRFDNAGGATLNRVTGGELSRIFGQLKATGSVYLINPSGVVVGPGGKIVTGGSFVASTRNVSNDGFMQGGALAFSGSSTSSVVNQGTIVSRNGDVVLIGASSTNHGAIDAPNGTAALVAGDAVVMTDTSGPDGIIVAPGVGKGAASTDGRINAAAVALASAGGNVYALAGNRGDLIQATGTTRINGQVWLSAPAGETVVTGKVAAANADGTGGSIVADGREVSIGGTANLSASGTRGGTVLVGVTGPEARDEADRTVVAAGAVIRAAGEGAGSGGHIETSGRQLSVAAATIDAGQGGSWLLDPVDLTIDASAATSIQSALNGGTNVTETTTATGSSGSGTTASGNGDINVASGISWSSAASLTLSAYRNINIQNGVTLASSGAGSLMLHADNAATGTGTVIFNGTGNVHFTGSGNVDLLYHPAAYPTATNYAGSVTMGVGAFTPYMTVDTAANLQSINSNLSGKYALNADIDASSVSNFVPIAHGANYTDSNQGFAGLFDGQHHTISNLNINDTSDTAVGLFAQTSSAGIIRNVGLVNATISNNVDYASVGALVGENFGTVSSVYVAGGSVATSGNGGPFVGGLVGENDGSIADTYASIAVSGVVDSGCLGCLSIGGLAGNNGFSNASASITRSLATGRVSSSGIATIGGFIGENDANITASYFDTQSTQQSSGIGFVNGTTNSVTAQTTAQLQSGTLPGGFGSSAWTAAAGSYPKLSWQIPPGLLVSGTVYFGSSPLSSITVVGLADGISFGSATTDASGNYSLTAPAGTTGVFTYLTGGTYKGNTFSNNGSTAFANVDIYSGRLTLINAGSSTYSGLVTALGGALGSNTSSAFLFSLGGGNLSLGSGANFALDSSVAIAIDRSIAGTGTTLLQSAGDLTLSNGISVSGSGSGTPLTLVDGGKFINSAGASALSVTGGGRWLVYSQNPANDTIGSLSHGFKQYAASYGSTTVAQSNGNGLLYSVAPTLSASLVGSTSKTYDGTTFAVVASPNIQATALTGDTAVFTATGATYANRNQGSGKSVTATGISATVTDSTGATVYGYQLSSNTATGNIGIINPAMLTYTANSASRTYGSSDPAFTGTVTGFVGGDTQASATTGTLNFGTPATIASNVGSYAVNGTGLTANNGNYSFQQAGGNATALTINPAALLYTANTASRTYGASNPLLSGTVTGFVNGDTQGSATTGTLSFTSPATTASNVGSYAVNGSGLTPNSNYTLQQAAGNATALTINPATLSYTADATSRAYGGTNPLFTGTVTGFVNGDTQASATTGALSFTSAATSASNVGSYAVNGAGLTANNGNYTFQQALVNATALTIDPATLLYTANTASRDYGASNPAFSGTVTGFVNGDTQASATTGTLSFSTAATSASNVGSYAINGSGLTSNSNYTLQQAAGNATALTIDPVTLFYSADAARRVYGASNPVFTGTVTGFVNGDTQATATTGALSFSTTATSGSNVGSYAVTGAGLTANNGNYMFQQTVGNATALMIDPATLFYSADAASRAYGASNPAFTGTVTGFVNGDTQATATTGALSFSTTATSASNVGSYAVNGTGLTTNGNYMLQQAPGNVTALTVSPATLLYTANASSRTYGDSNPVFSGGVTGLVNGDTLASVASGTLTFGSAASAATHVGQYAIDGSGLSLTSGNYVLQQAVGNATALTINPATLIYVADGASRTYGDASPGLTGTVTGFVNGDTLANATAGTLSFTSAADLASDVGKYAIEGGGLTANHGNYVFSQAGANATALSITPYELIASLTGVVSKPFDRTDQATLSAGNYVLSATRNGDVVTLDAPVTGTYATTAAGTDIPVTVSGLSLTGVKAGDYRLANSTVSAAIGEIQQAAPSVAFQRLFVSLEPSVGGAGLALLGDTSGVGPLPGILPVRESALQDAIQVSLGLPVITEPEQAIMQAHRGKTLVINLPSPHISSQLEH